MPLERRHNILRAGSGLIRKCLTLVKAGFDRPDVLFHDPSANLRRYCYLPVAALRPFSRIHRDLRRLYDRCRFVCYIIWNIYIFKSMMFLKRTNSELILFDENIEGDQICYTSSMFNFKFLNRLKFC